MTAGLHDFLVDLTSGDDDRAEAAVAGIAALDPPGFFDAMAALQELLAASDIDTRWWAVRALAAIPETRVPSLLLQALEDPDASVRQCAALGLRLHPDPQAAPALALALNDNDHLVVALAADALAELGEPAVPTLLEVMGNGSQVARLEAVRALAAIGDKRAIPALFAALNEDSALMEYWANEGLERMGVGMVFFTP